MVFCLLAEYERNSCRPLVMVGDKVHASVASKHVTFGETPIPTSARRLFSLAARPRRILPSCPDKRRDRSQLIA
jgi:hypothetical protein